MTREIARKVLEIESRAIKDLVPRIDERFDEAIEILFASAGRVVVTGIGKSGIIGQKISATLSSTGTPSLFLHPAEAVHGDLGRIVKGDVALAVSNSGDTPELLTLIPLIKRLDCPLVAMSGNPQSTLAGLSDVHLDISISEEACPLGLAPTASTTAALAMGDALAMALLERRGFTVDDFATLHPGGRIGKKLLRVEDVMHTGDQIPRVEPATPMKDALFEMTHKRMGVTSVVNGDGVLLGVISDGDLRRHIERRGESFLRAVAQDCMTPNPITIDAREMATSALDIMERRRVTSLFVVDGGKRLTGLVHLHDLWTTELI
jgi:arabinose-5-phosphate isomerase